jgi:hypothetical protein
MSTADDRAAYMRLIEDVLSWRDLTIELTDALTIAVEAYGDPLHLTDLMGLPVEHEPEQHGPGGRIRAEHTRPSVRTEIRPRSEKALDDIVEGLIRDNPGRTNHQLVAAMSTLSDEDQFHPPTMSSVITRLVRADRIVRALCDTERGLKFYVKGAAPAGVLIVPSSLDTSRMGREAMREHARPPTVAEMGGDVRRPHNVIRLPDVEPVRASGGMQARRPAHPTGGYIEGAKPDPTPEQEENE